MSRIAGSILLTTVVLCATLPLRPQAVAPDEVRIRSGPWQPTLTLRAQTNEVQVEVVVRTAHGKPVSGLKESDFQVLDENKPQKLSGFAVETSLPPAATPVAKPVAAPAPQEPAAPVAAPAGPPRYLALYFDDIHTETGDLRHIQIAAERLVREGLTADDHVAIFTPSGSQSLDFTQDHDKLLAAIEQLKIHPREEGLGSNCPRIGAYEAYLIANNLDPSILQTEVQQCQACTGGSTASVYNPAVSAGNSGQSLGSIGISDEASNSCVRQVKFASEQIWAQTVALSRNTIQSVDRVVQRLASAPGTRVLLVGSSGFVAATMENDVDRVIDQALRAGIVINSIDAKGLFAQEAGKAERDLALNGGASGNELAMEMGERTMQQENMQLGAKLLTLTDAMADFAFSTGGQFFKNNNDLIGGYHQLGAVPEVAYRLNFVPEPFTPDGKFHRLKVKTTRGSSVFVYARPGYFANQVATQQGDAGPTASEALSGSEQRQDVAVEITPQSAHTSAGAPEVAVKFHVDLDKLPVEQRQDRHVEKLTFIAALFDKDGAFVTGKTAEMDLALKDGTFARFSKSGISGTLDLPVAPGGYRLRALVEEGVQRKSTLATREIQVQ